MTNSAPTGFFVVLVDGLPDVGETLTARPGAIQDEDGIKHDQIVFQWFAGPDPIPGANDSTLLLTEAYAGQVVTVVASYTDGAGNREQVTARPIGHYVTSKEMEKLVGLYESLFGREPDGPGLAYWAHEIAPMLYRKKGRLRGLQDLMGLFVEHAHPADLARMHALETKDKA